ncbi:Atxe2 family lasso peptide isopeptidase [Sphingobium lactosutens]|uniref:Atxe2 family lasso peptide isopeptidase n=1 Tax=Sphingobium lactosutens TaxID=522773 RepID=UPI0004CE12FD|nr:Atxe2 family lasso peptide isopeptidase [Sphingobium lactosutens]
MRLRAGSILCVGLWALVPHTAMALDSCSRLDWSKVEVPAGRAAVTPRDLVTLRDIGSLGDAVPEQHIFAISPDQRSVAFQVRQGDPDRNSFCLGMVVMRIGSGAVPLFVDRGGDLIREEMDATVEPRRSTGVPAIITPQWSPDGNAIYFLKRDNGVVQVWRADAMGNGSRPVTAFDQDVQEFALDGMGSLTASVRSGVVEARAASDHEALTGYHFDDRFMPFLSDRPKIPRSPPFTRYQVDLRSGQRTAIAGGGGLPISTIGAGSQNPRALGVGCSVDRREITTGVPPQTRLEIRCANGPVSFCSAAACTNTSGPVWMPDRSSVRFLRREGWADTIMATYEWKPATQTVRKLFETSDFLIDCQPLRKTHLACLRETSVTSRRLVVIDTDTGTMTTIVDPNPEFERLTLGRVERIPLKSDAGLEAFGDVVFPEGYRAGHRYPAVVVQYQSRGFLRGGTGDEFPIQAFANRGFAVLSVQRPQPVGARARPRDYVEVDRIGLQDFADRRSVLSVVENGVRTLIDRGIADPAKIGITGLSDGSSTVQFAALNSRLFAAGIASGCCWEPGQTAILGPAMADVYRRIGWPGVSAVDDAFWARMSIAKNARRVAFPILFETSDEEFRVALESYTALKEVGKPADLFIFPDEHHIKWQPAHKLAAYERSIDWFEFWLRGAMPEDPRRKAEAARWAAMSSIQ